MLRTNIFRQGIIICSKTIAAERHPFLPPLYWITILVPTIKYDFSDCLCSPIADLSQFFRAEFSARVVPTLIQLGKALEMHQPCRQPEPLGLTGQNKSAGIIPLSKGRIGIMDVLQNKNEVVMSTDLSRIEVCW